VLAHEQLELSRQRPLRTVALVLQLRDRPRLRLMLRRYSSASSLNVICASRPLRRWRRSSATSNACNASPRVANPPTCGRASHDRRGDSGSPRRLAIRASPLQLEHLSLLRHHRLLPRSRSSESQVLQSRELRRRAVSRACCDDRPSCRERRPPSNALRPSGEHPAPTGAPPSHATPFCLQMGSFHPVLMRRERRACRF
jgi:hypothetical protein